MPRPRVVSPGLLWTALAAAVLGLVPPAVAAQSDPLEICNVATDTLQSCEAKADRAAAKELGLAPAAATQEAQATMSPDAMVATVKDAAASRALDAMEQKSTGTGSATSTASTISDFLSLLAVSSQSGGPNSDPADNLTLELNRFLGLPTDDGYKLTVRARDAAVSDQLIAKFPEELQATKREQLDQQLSNLDNLLFTFSYSPVSRAWGRSTKPHDDLWDALFAAVRLEAAPQELEAGNKSNAQLEVLEEVAEKHPDLANDAESGALELSKLNALDTALTKRLVEATVADRFAYHRWSAGVAKALEQTRFVDMADLIANQPQLSINATRTVRDPLVGPEETHLQVSYELGFVNVNRLRHELESCLGVDSLQPVVSTLLRDAPATATTDTSRSLQASAFSSCYQKFFERERNQQGEKGHRLTFSLEYQDIAKLDVMLPKDMVTLTLPGERKTVAKLAYGRYLSIGNAAPGDARLDFAWSYEDVDEKSMRNRRSVAELSYSQRVAGNLVLSAALVYANKPEFRGDVNEPLGARLGLKYKLFKKGKLGN